MSTSQPSQPTRSNPLDRNHAQLESEVRTFLESHRLHGASATYHDVMPLETQEVLKRNYSIDALYVRTRADRIAVTTELCFQWEAKTASNKWRTLAIEALPFCFHYVHAKVFGLRTLYAVRMIADEATDHGFWVGDDLQIAQVVFPGGRETPDRKKIGDIVQHVFNGIKIFDCGAGGGSNDPFLQIEEDVIKAKADWRSLIHRLVDQPS